jgi:GH15 family glucan-1,4-alpha-glucosidase
MQLQMRDYVTVTGETTTPPRYRPIGQYGVIGDCRTAVLIGPDGSVDWGCLPHFDSPAIFCRLLDADRGGYFRLGPSGRFDASMTYLPGTNILETTFQTGDGRLRLVDFMPVRPRQTQSSLLARLSQLLPTTPHGMRADLEREAGNDVAAAHRIARIATCLEGQITLELTLKATFDYARQEPVIERQNLPEDAAGAILSAGGRYLVLLVRYLPSSVAGVENTPIVLEREDTTLRARIPLQAGQRIAVALNYARDVGEAHAIMSDLVQHDVDADLDETRSYWRDWTASCQYNGPYQQAVIRSALALKLCTFEPTGAIVAAVTTSLPEGIGGVRNWDYRYTWLRDSAFTLQALEQLGYYSEARDYFHFLHDLHVRNVNKLRIMYGICGEAEQELAEHLLDHLEGYRGSRPVRIGNGAATQHQLDVYGEVLDAAISYLDKEGYRRGHRQAEQVRDLRHLAERIADYVYEHWQELDNGIWEVRGKPRAFVYSRAMCWVALDRACKMAEHHGHERHAPRWARAREQIHADVMEHGYDAGMRSFTQAYGDPVLDAANLRLLLARFLPETDPHIQSTIDVTAHALAGPDGLLYRYRPAGAGSEHDAAEEAGAADDGLPGSEGMFIACTYWLIQDLCILGRVEEARQLFERLLTYGSPLGLFSEELDPKTGELIGNYPQAFTHIGLINSAVMLQHAQEGRLHPWEGILGHHNDAAS